MESVASAPNLLGENVIIRTPQLSAYSHKQNAQIRSPRDAPNSDDYVLSSCEELEIQLILFRLEIHIARQLAGIGKLKDTTNADTSRVDYD